ncbi:MAG: hypothetical protein AB7O66_18785 [Limisphaerales bacterium]
MTWDSRDLMRWFWASLAAVTLLAVALGIRRFVAPRIVGRAVSPTGVEMAVIQKYNWSGEPFTTSFVYRRPGTNWAWCYFDHQDNHWGYSQVVLDTNRGVATFLRDGRPALSFEWEAGIYRRGPAVGIGGGEPDAPNFMPADWTPEGAGYR